MNPALLMVIAVAFFAIGNVIIEQKAAKEYHQLTIMVCYLAPMLPLALLARKMFPIGPGVTDFPHGTTLLIVVAVGFVFFLGDYFMIGAYTNGGDAFTVTSVAILFPVFASLFRLLFEVEWPNMYQVTGYVLAAAAVLFLAKGGSVE